MNTASTLQLETYISQFPVIEGLKGVLQSPEFHSEGDVFIHTQMVCETLLSSTLWQSLNDELKDIVFLATLLHDIGKIDTTKIVNGKITSMGHSQRGAKMARKILFELNVPFEKREHIVTLIRHHQIPFWILERDNSEQLIQKISQTVRCDLLTHLATCDAKGRIANDTTAIIENVQLFEELASSQTCLNAPFPFASNFGRLLYFKDKWTVPSHAPYEDFTCKMIIMSGLPGAGKDTWIHKNHPNTPVVSLDHLRRTHNVLPTDNQGHIIQMAKEHAKQYLRKGTSFIWNATNLQESTRSTLVDLALNYKAEPHIVYVEANYQTLMQQNQNRDYSVPQNVMSQFINHRWDVPKPYEAVGVEHVVHS